MKNNGDKILSLNHCLKASRANQKLFPADSPRLQIREFALLGGDIGMAPADRRFGPAAAFVAEFGHIDQKVKEVKEVEEVEEVKEVFTYGAFCTSNALWSYGKILTCML